MEEQLTPLLVNIIEKSQEYHFDINILEKYYKLFESKKYLGNDFKNIYSDMEDNYSINLQSLRYGYNNNDEQVIYQSLVLSVIHETDIKKKTKLIPLIIYLDNNRIFYEHLHKINYFSDFVNDIKDFLIGTASNSGIKIEGLEELSPYHQEKEWYENYQKGTENLNFKQIYSFIEGIEKGMGHRFNVYLDFLIFIAYKYFFEDLVKIVNSKKDMLDIIYLTNILNTEEILNLAKNSNNYLLKFESIRNSVYFKSNNAYCLNLLKPERNLVKGIIIELSKKQEIWKEFLDYYLEYPLRSIQLFEPMSKSILEIDNDCISDITQAIKIDRHSNDDSRNALNSLILNIENNEIKKEILEKIFYRWSEFINNYSEYIESIILTNTIDIVTAYTAGHLDKILVIKNINKILDNIDEIENYWVKDRSEQKNYFYKQMTKLYVYGFSLEKYKLCELRKRIEYICDNNILKNESSHNSKTTLQLFQEHIFKECLAI